MENNELLYRIAITLVQWTGHVSGKKMIAYCGGVKEVFEANKAKLLKIPGISLRQVEALKEPWVFDRAREELRIIRDNGIEPIFFLDKAYPARLLNCADSPMMLYFRGAVDFNTARVLAVVGTRRATEYGKLQCRRIIEELAPFHPLIVSGVAYGIDTVAHKSAVEFGLPTIGVFGHGLDRIYPASNTSLVQKMKYNGGELTEFMSMTIPDRENFPKRNRIIAGLCDAIVVVEAAREGGALITARLASGYNRDVFAIPGRIDDEYSRGCNQLIHNGSGKILLHGHDIAGALGWKISGEQQPPPQITLFPELSTDEQTLVEILRAHAPCSIDKLTIESGLPAGKVLASLLNLEFAGVVRMLPGKMYSLYR